MTVQSVIESKLEAAFNPESLQVINESHKHHVPKNSETHFLVILVSDQFEQCNRVQRQRQVYQCLAEELRGCVHALSMRLFTSKEWEQQSDKIFPTPACEG